MRILHRNKEITNTKKEELTDVFSWLFLKLDSYSSFIALQMTQRPLMTATPTKHASNGTIHGSLFGRFGLVIKV